jgi:predicted site-specific integrase-resolvase
MKLVTPKVAAEQFGVTPGMIWYWLKKGRINRYPIEGKPRNYLVSLDEVWEAVEWRATLLDSHPDLITREEAARLIGVNQREISYYAKMGYLRKHYVFGNGKHYLVERKQVLEQPKRIAEMYSAPERKQKLRELAKSQPRSGSLFVKRQTD